MKNLFNLKNKKDKNKYDNYIFDLYGTLVDIHTDETKKALWKNMAMYYSLHGANYEANEFAEKYFSLCKKETKLLPGPDEEVEINLDTVFKRLYEDKLVSPSEELIKATELMFRSISLKYIKVYPKALKMLKELNKRNKNIYLLTNAQASFTVAELKMLEIYGCFKKIYISSECGYKKPSDKFFNKLIEEEKLDLTKTIMIGNELSSDIEGANRVNIDSFYIKSNLSSKNDNIINDMATYSYPMKTAYKKLLSL